MSVLHQLEPQPLWAWFAQICAIPHPSYHEEAIAQHIMSWAKSQNLWCERDEVGNVLIRKPATKGYEDHTPVALQAHLDMVPQANEDTPHDFVKDPIVPRQEGEWVYATGTTLGADNGIGMASCLAVLQSQDVPHPPLEVLLTMTEEVGMDGAQGLKPNWLTSSILINTDSEDIDELIVGCAGGEDVDISLDLSTQAVSPQSHAVSIVLKGLRGGHSGVDIHKGRGNAIQLLARFLAHYSQSHGVQLMAFTGGNVRNAIPREAQASLCVDDVAQFEQATQQFQAKLQQELSGVEDGITVQTHAIALPTEPVISQASSQKALDLLSALPNGVVRQSVHVLGVVETSLNLGLASIEKQQLQITVLVRSLIEGGKENVRTVIQSLCHLAGAQCTFSGGYVGWEPKVDSPILQKTKEIYEKVMGKAPHVSVIHAGLECGLFKKQYPAMDMVSMGPTIQSPHSPNERVNIASVQAYWRILCDVLKAL